MPRKKTASNRRRARKPVRKRPVANRKATTPKPTTPTPHAPASPPPGSFGCLNCGRWFVDEALHAAHIVPARDGLSGYVEPRCLDRDEMRALDWVHLKSGLWSRSLHTQERPMQIARLPTVRGPLWPTSPARA